MPELYGKPFKDELRAEIHSLNRALLNERKEHWKTQDALEHALFKIEELEGKIKRMEQKARHLLNEAIQDESDVGERFREFKRRRHEAEKEAILSALAESRERAAVA